MLQSHILAPQTFRLLKSLQNEPQLANFNLAGGTALALYLGHRKSIDLDLFTNQHFDNQFIKQVLESKFDFKTSFMEADTLKDFIGDIKVDCLSHIYPDVQTSSQIDGVRLYSIPDIIAMKLSAIADNGTRLKDFVDVAFLSCRYSLKQMLDFYGAKYGSQNVIRPLKAINYFDDIDFGESVVMTSTKFNWKRIAHRLNEMTRNQMQVFDCMPI